MAAISAAISNARAVAGRAVHIKIHPRPRNITESREILRVLQRYGEVIMFKNLKYEPGAPAPNTALAIYRKAEAAERAMNASPINFVYGEREDVPERDREAILFDRDGQHERDTVETRRQTDGFLDAEDSIVLSLAKDEIGNVGIAGEKAPTDRNVSDTSPPKAGRWESMPNLTSTSTTSATSTTNTVRTSFLPISPPKLSSCSSSSSSYSPPSTSPFDPPPPEPRLSPLPCTLAVSPSGLNHATYISRQHYHGPYYPSSHTIPSQDLELRVPLQGHMDLRLDKPEVPVRVRARREEVGRISLLAKTDRGLKGLWERGAGMRARDRWKGSKSVVLDTAGPYDPQAR